MYIYLSFPSLVWIFPLKISFPHARRVGTHGQGIEQSKIKNNPGPISPS